MSKTTWNIDQEKILDNLSGNIVASASAGSGKTTVMLERILRQLAAGVPIERILVLAYNTAIAIDIKAKLVEKLESVAAGGGDMAQLFARQLDNIEKASISTIDSFCSSIIKEYFQLLDIDPNFTIMGEMQRKSVLNGIIGGKIAAEKAEKDSLIYQLNTMFGGQSNLQDSIAGFANFIATVPDRLDWVENIALSNCIEGQSQSQLIDDAIGLILLRGNFTLKVVSDLMGDLIHSPNRQSDLEYFTRVIAKLIKCKTLEELRGEHRLINPPRKIAVKKEERYMDFSAYDKARCAAKEYFSAVGSVLSGSDKAVQSTKKMLKYYLSIADDVSQQFTVVKAQQGDFDFTDLTYWAIKLLTIDGVAEEIANRYDSVCVDEYQDANYCQDFIIGKISRNNLFLVGDIKQSIYRFRNAEPSILQGSFRRAEEGSDGNTAVRLNYNYRSDVRLLNFVNNVFNQILSNECGGIEYRAKEQLKEGTEYLPASENEQVAEVNIFVGEAEKPKRYYDFNTDIYDITTANRGAVASLAVVNEGNYVADKISQLVSGHQIYDAKQGKFRAISYSDICILVKSRNRRVEAIMDIVAARGIPIDIKGLAKDGLDRNIKYVNNVLRVIDNDMQDIPLSAALRGAIGLMSYDMLASIRVMYPQCQFFHQACRMAQKDIPQLSKFYATIRRLRTMLATKSIAEVVSYMVYECGIWASLGYLDDADVARHNVSQFLDKLAGDDMTLPQYIAALDSGEDAEYTPYQSGGNIPCVNTSTIHGSKGLEYPIVFMVDCGDKLKKGNNFSVLSCNVKYGIITDNYDDANMAKAKSTANTLYNFVADQEGQNEGMRLLYVAMTRARNMLFISGSAKAASPPTTPYDATSFLSWLLYAGSMDSRVDSKVNVIKCEAEQPAVEEKATKIATIDKSIQPSSQFVDYVNYRYPHENLKDLSIKYTVTEINHNDTYEDEIAREYLPSVDAEVASPQRGTNYHKVLEHIDYSAVTPEAVRSQLQLMQQQGILTEEDLQGVNAQELANVMKSDIMQYAANNRHLREQKFMLYASASKVFGKDYGDEEILIQGAIDLVVLGSSICLVDFKKTRKSDDAIRKTYHRQIELYTLAIEEALSVKVDRKVIVVIGDGRTIEF